MINTSKAYEDYVVFVDSKALRGRSKAEYLRQVRKLGTRHPERSLKQISERMVFDHLIHLRDKEKLRPSTTPFALLQRSRSACACGGTALILSNELVDAFPCRVFEKRPDGWRELALRLDDGRIMEEWVVRPLPDSTVFLHPWPDGQRVEVQESFQVWLRGWLPALAAGSMLTIDYGDTCPALYFRRPRRNTEGLCAPSAAGRP